MDIELYSEHPHRPLGQRLSELVKDGTSIDIAVAFVSQAGAEAIQLIKDQLTDRVPVRLVVSVLFPTDLDAIARLAHRIEVWIHLGYEEAEEKLHGQFHSKILFIERSNQSRVIVVGSHNWTKNGLEGVNLEASLVVTCEEADLIVRQTREHILACRSSSKCELFNPSRLALYKEIQRRYHSTVPNPTIPFFGFAESEALVFLAEDHTGGALADKGVVFIRIPSEWRKKPSTGTQVWLFVFPSNSLFRPRPPMPKPYRLEGEPEAVSRNPQRLYLGNKEYFIDDIQQPCVKCLEKIPELSQGEEWAVIPFEKNEQELLPLFHAGSKLPPPRVKEPNEDEMADDLSPRVGHERGPIAPKNVIAKAVLQVPFQFAYPRTAKRLIEEYQHQTRNPGDAVAYEVELGNARQQISEYVCSVKFQSNSHLTQAIHRNE